MKPSDESMIRGCERPVDLNPYIELTRAFDERARAMQLEIEGLKALQDRRRLGAPRDQREGRTP